MAQRMYRLVLQSAVMAVVLASMWVASITPLQAQTNFYTIYTNGPASNRVNVVFLAEGYRTNDYTVFRTAATNVANALLATEPFAEYRPYVNVFAIAVPSVEAGSDHPGSSLFRNTYFNSSYDASDQIITMPTNPTGQGKVDALLATYLPLTDLSVLLVNDPTPAGSDNGGKTAITSTAANSISYIPAHESGHVLGKLGDEYSGAYPGYPDVEEPNTTRETNRAAIKWNAWITAATPVPTPSTFEFLDTVGLFEGAHYHTNGWYRPKINCMMNDTAGVPFCEVCREALVLSFYRRIRPVESSIPIAKNLTTTSNQSLTFAVSLLQPATHALSVQWLTNGVTVAGATNSSFSILPALLANGTNTVTARVNDSTPWVRNDPTNYLVQTQAWTLTVSLPLLQLKSPRWLGGGKFAFQVAGIAPQGFVLQGSSNLVIWTPLTTNPLVNGVFEYTNQVGGLPVRFYRAFTPP